ESGWDVAGIADRVGLRRSPSRNLGDHEQNGGRRQHRQRDRDQRPAIAEDLVDLFSEDDSQRAHYFTASTRDRNESSRSWNPPRTSAVGPLATTRPWWMIVTRSQRRSASCSTCVEKMTHFPRLFDSTMN